MEFGEPRVEFIEMELIDTTSTSGNQAQVGQCGGVKNDDDCVEGAAWNYPIDDDEP